MRQEEIYFLSERSKDIKSQDYAKVVGYDSSKQITLQTILYPVFEFDMGNGKLIFVFLSFRESV